MKMGWIVLEMRDGTYEMDEFESEQQALAEFKKRQRNSYYPLSGMLVMAKVVKDGASKVEQC